VQERARYALEFIGIGNDFLNKTQKAQQLREMIGQWDYMKLKTFCTTKEVVTRLKRQPKEWKKTFASYISDKGLITRMYTKLKKLTSPKINGTMKNTNNSKCWRGFGKNEPSYTADGNVN
jgi:hypothetical protein